MVLNAMGARRVFEIQSGGTAELIGLNITGGSALCAECSPFEPSATFPPVSRESNPCVTFHRPLN